MRFVDVTILAGGRVTAASKAVKRFDPSALMGPILRLVRTSQPLHVDLTDCPDTLARLSGLLALLDELDELEIPYEIAVSDGPATKADISAELVRLTQWRREQAAAAEAIELQPPPENSARLQRLGEIFHERWRRLGFEGLLPEERDHVLLWELHAEVSNGGFDQYLTNSSGDHALDAAESLRRVGPQSVLVVLLGVLDAIPGGWCADRVERNRRLASMPEGADLLQAHTNEYYSAIERETAGGELIDSIENAYLRAGLLARSELE